MSLVVVLRDTVCYLISMETNSWHADVLSDIYPHNVDELFSRKWRVLLNKIRRLLSPSSGCSQQLKQKNIHGLALTFILNLPVRERWSIHKHVRNPDRAHQLGYRKQEKYRFPILWAQLRSGLVYKSRTWCFALFYTVLHRLYVSEISNYLPNLSASLNANSITN